MEYISKDGPYVSNLSAKKTGYYMKTDLNKEIKEEDERRALLNQPVKEVRAITKNRVPAAIWPTPGDLYIQDRNWLKKANPEAHLAEKEYLERDY